MGSFYASVHEDTKDFIEEYLELCRKHEKCIVPSYEGQIDFHNKMIVVPLDSDCEEYIVGRTAVEIDD